ncbi:hypothetical protein EDC04DRAFT_102895 [Pisolithus marmoratus]|nr:hypothetical protein EDC04DRAFT_102895 [Pisolithus marmoratus]
MMSTLGRWWSGAFGLVLLLFKVVAKHGQTVAATLHRYYLQATDRRASRPEPEPEPTETIMPPAQSVDYTQAPPKLVLDEFVNKALTSTPSELHPFFEAFRNLYTRKLWHHVWWRWQRRSRRKLTTQLSFLTSLLSRIDTETAKEAHVLLLANIAHAKLVYGDLVGTKTDMDAAWKILDQLDGVDNAVNAAYYRVAAEYYKAKAEYAPYYKHSLLYLACVDVASDLTRDERLLRAHDLSISAFLGDTIYNFGELLMHPILDALDNTQYDWIKKLLFTFNEGNIGKFEALAPLFPQEPILEQNYPFLRQKICLMALIESVFKRNVNDRTLSFQSIAEETRLPLDEVEHLIMKALSLKLIRGSMNQVDQKAHITWVQPRVLSRVQIGELATRLGAWMEKLGDVEKRIAPEVSVSA